MAIHDQPLLEIPRKNSHDSDHSYTKTFFLLLSLVAIVGATALVASYMTKSDHSSITSSISCHHLCAQALDRPTCLTLISEVANGAVIMQMSYSNVNLLLAFLEKTRSHIEKATDMASAMTYRINDPIEQEALHTCVKLMDISIGRVRDSMVAIMNGSVDSHYDAHTWLSSVLTHHVTCLDTLHGSARTLLESQLNDLISRATTSLDIFVTISPSTGDVIKELNEGFPSWVTGEDRELMQAGVKAIKADVTVSLDGSGKYTKVSDAVAHAPDNSPRRYTIYVKKGIYREHVVIEKTKMNLMLVGDGASSTIITGDLSNGTGTNTFNSATVGVNADGFIAQDIGFRNTAGPQNKQAVALRVTADRAVVYRCNIDAYQDTLYADANNQFYRESTISGTVDFIFGNAAVVLQNCNLVVNKPMNGQSNTITAQGRTVPNQNTGISIQFCKIFADRQLEQVQRSVQTYLGRPWKLYSRTMVMQSTLGTLIHPTGWSTWDGSAFALSTLYYAEFNNSGPGASTNRRVKWRTYHAVGKSEEAMPFTVANLIQGRRWLSSTGVPFWPGL